MRYHSFLRSPKKEEQQVPDSVNSYEEFSDTIKDGYANGEVDIMDDLERIWGIEDGDEDDEKLPKGHNMFAGQDLNWDFMNWDEFPNGEEGDGEVENEVFGDSERCLFEEESYCKKVVKKEYGTVGFCDDDEDMKKVQLNLNLNYQEVLDAWSDRGSLWAVDCSSHSSMAASNGNYMGEVPVMEEEKNTRREASVLRYKEKRQSRLFSKKIRYQVRKLNADKRPRHKGRFVKRVS
ncbi:zinc finger protein CONSTANS-LIKE 7 [Argentina anserina]|uniref:zinc finger protein CONSTANS-LIKE 7 n=1 Tax=Argentina anserina TaxID=57926 RepID=UPI00217620BB|nr:zinc finger protein CONSTANS-LIKE 7 [Potentilla anserina]